MEEQGDNYVESEISDVDEESMNRDEESENGGVPEGNATDNEDRSDDVESDEMTR